MSVLVQSHNPLFTVSLVEQNLQTSADGHVNAEFVAVGDTINTDEQEGFLRGHGTQVIDGKLLATVCGMVERVNKLVYVKPLKNRYTAQQGDVVVGRVTEVAGKRWKVDLNSRQEAHLQLSAVNLPGGIQRRRNAEDELNMRIFLKEGSLVSAEVQSVHSDGTIALHTRSFKYGQLRGGQIVTVPPNLVKRQKQHFHTFEGIGVDVILGINGIIWVAPTRTPANDGVQPEEEPCCSKQQLQAACRIANSVRSLAALHMPIYPAIILHIYEMSFDKETSLREMLEPDFLTLIVQGDASRHSLLT